MKKKMAWYWIVLIVLAALYVLAFIAYMCNADMKLVESLYKSLMKYHNNRTDIEERI